MNRHLLRLISSSQSVVSHLSFRAKDLSCKDQTGKSDHGSININFLGFITLGGITCP